MLLNRDRMLKRLQLWLARLEDFLLACLLTGLIVLAVTQILLRNLLDTGLAWADPTLRIMVLWLAMLGAMAATRDGNHIHIDLISRYLPEHGRVVSRAISNLFGSIVCGLLAWHAGRFTYIEWQDAGLLFASVPAWLAAVILPIGFGIMAFRFLTSALMLRFGPGSE